jgi:Cdc6-like AAA superfamily ATPase
LASLIDWATSDKKETAVRLITGQGGSGKSRLAAELALELRHRSRLRRTQSPVTNSDPELTRCLQNIFGSFNRLYSAGLRLFGDGTRLNIITTNLFLALEALLGPGIIPARGKETTITMLNVSRSCSARGLSLTTLQLPSLALTLAELSVILSGRTDEQQTVLIQILELFEHILSSTKDPGFSEISAEVRADFTGLRSSQNASGCLAKMRAKCKLPDDAVRSSIWNVGCIMTFVLSNLLLDIKGSIY